ncbi:MAG: amidase family protein, partial [bacterium]
PNLPWKIGEKVNDPVKMYLSDVYTVAVNLAGLPAINIPFYNDYLPVGIQIISNYFQDAKIISLAHILQDIQRGVKG